MHTKSLSRVEIKDATQGLVTAVFSTFGVIDLDGDVTSKSTFTEGAPVVVSAYGHTSWDGSLPIGKGTISTTDTEAVAELQFFLNTTHGRDAFETIKELSAADLQEWSYSLENTVAKRGELNGKQARFIEQTTVKEVSPVLKGASIGTRTLAVKTRKQLAGDLEGMLCAAGEARWGSAMIDVEVEDYDPDAGYVIFERSPAGSWDDDDNDLVQVDYTVTDGAVTLGSTETPVQEITTYAPKAAGSNKFSKRTDIALRGVKELVEMAVERLTHRAAEGKSITEQTDAYDQLLAELAPLKTAIEGTATADATQTHSDELTRIFLGLVANSQGATS